VLSVVVVVHRRVVSLLILKIVASAGTTPLSPLPLSSYPLCSRSLVYLIVACIRNRFDGRSFSSIDASQTFSWVIVVAVIIVAVVTVVAARVSTPLAMPVASTAVSVVVVFVFAPALPPATAVLCRRPVNVAS
jgi:hypothetical protein